MQNLNDRPWLAAYSPSVPAEFAPRVRNGVELFERGVRERPDAPAILYFDAELTFAEAGALARSFAVALRDELGVAPGDRVGLMLQNVPEMPIALHGAWLAGAITTSISPMNKRRELLHQLNDADVRVIVCLEAFYELLDSVREETPLQHIVTVSELDRLAEVPALLASHRRYDCPNAVRFADLAARHDGGSIVAADPDPRAPAMLSYTSGTTGAPKGAINTHGAVAHNAEVWERWYGLDEHDVVVAMAPLFHITGVMGHVAAARSAMCPLLIGFRYEAGEIMRLIERRRGSFIVGALTAFVAMLEHPDLGKRDLSSLTKIASGGAPVVPAVVERFEQAVGAYIHNTFGMTETASALHLVPFGVRAPVDPDSGALSIGVPVCGAESRIVDGEGSELPAGEIGEIVTRGPMVTTGYWQNPQATEQALVDGWLHTGDVGKRDEQGWFWIVDRIKDMINVSGYKVWPREVEDVLYEHPAVNEASVVGVPDEYRGETVRAYVTLRGGARATEQELIEHCRATTAVYKAPRQVRIVDELPKTASGKVLRRELRERARGETGDATVTR